MIDVSLTEWYTECEQWAQNLPPAQYALVQGFIWFAMWTALELVFGQQSALEGISFGLIGGLTYGGLSYRWERPPS